jgi:hypothetical protein
MTRDFGHFPAKNGFPGIPVKAWIRFPGCAEPVHGGVRPDGQGGRSDVEGRADDLPDVGVESGGHPPRRHDEQGPTHQPTHPHGTPK